MTSTREPAHDGAPDARRLAHECRRWRLIAMLSALGIVTVFFAAIGALLCHSARASAEQGDLDDANAKLRWGQGLTLAGISIAMLTAVAYLATR